MNGVSKLTTVEEVTLVTFDHAPASPAFLSDFFRLAAEKRINIDMVSQTAPQGGNISLSCTIMDHELTDILAVNSALKGKYPALRAASNAGNAKIVLNGDMKDSYGVMDRVISLFAEKQVEINLITTSEDEISILISGSSLGKVIPSLKERFAID